ncbi:hypothetical protein [Nitrosophilus labii]|uniref:hypothetical protein n=1 Tax=Nitrosophilus labii TaxID=2706014 RepID=UPI001657446D|nr:hypothetical protein [Nitrosophilus labii]
MLQQIKKMVSIIEIDEEISEKLEIFFYFLILPFLFGYLFLLFGIDGVTVKKSIGLIKHYPIMLFFIYFFGLMGVLGLFLLHVIRKQLLFKKYAKIKKETKKETNEKVYY